MEKTEDLNSLKKGGSFASHHSSEGSQTTTSQKTSFFGLLNHDQLYNYFLSLRSPSGSIVVNVLIFVFYALLPFSSLISWVKLTRFVVIVSFFFLEVSGWCWEFSQIWREVYIDCGKDLGSAVFFVYLLLGIWIGCSDLDLCLLIGGTDSVCFFHGIQSADERFDFVYTWNFVDFSNVWLWKKQQQVLNFMTTWEYTWALPFGFFWFLVKLSTTSLHLTWTVLFLWCLILLQLYIQNLNLLDPVVCLWQTWDSWPLLVVHGWSICFWQICH